MKPQFKIGALLLAIVLLLILAAFQVRAQSGFGESGTQIGSPITVGVTNNSFPSGYNYQMQGTDKSVWDIPSRDAIPALRRGVGSMVYVVSTDQTFRQLPDTNSWVLLPALSTNFTSSNYFVAITVQNILNASTNLFITTNVTVQNFLDLTTNVTVVTNVTFVNPVSFYTNIFVQAAIFTNGLTNLSLTANSVVGTDANKKEVSIANASGVLTNGGSGPAVFGAVANAQLQNSSLTIAGTANQVTVSGGGPVALGGTATASLPSVLIAPGTFAAVTGITNQGFASGGVVTNDANGKFYSASALPSTVLPTDVFYVDKNNALTSASSNFNAAVWTSQTNSSAVVPDFSFAGSTATLSTNASFTWLAPTHVDTTGKAEQWIITHITNTVGNANITMTAPSNVHVCGSGSMVVTNWSEILWEYVPPSGPTNMWPIPGY